MDAADAAGDAKAIFTLFVAGGAAAVAWWAFTRPHVVAAILQGWTHFLEWLLKRALTEEEVMARRRARLSEDEAKLAAGKTELLREYKDQVAALRIEVHLATAGHADCQAKLARVARESEDFKSRNDTLAGLANEAMDLAREHEEVLQALRDRNPTLFPPP